MLLVAVDKQNGIGIPRMVCADERSSRGEYENEENNDYNIVTIRWRSREGC